MLINTALVASVIVAVIGLSILWSNPARQVNWAVAVCSWVIAAWLGFLYLAIIAPRETGVTWLRWSCAIGAIAPLSFWAVKESIIGVEKFTRIWWIRSSIGTAITAPLFVVPFTEIFIPSHSTSVTRIFGWGYYAYMWTLLAFYVYMLVDAFRLSRKLSGGRRLELQLWLGGGCAMVASVLITMALNAATGDRIYIRTQPLLVLLFYAGLAFAITARRIFDARQIFLVSIEKTSLVMVIAGAAYLLDRVFGALLPEPLAFLATTAVALWIAVTLSSWLDRALHFYPQAISARHAAFNAARRESRFESLEQAFVNVLRGWGQTDRAVVVAGVKGPLVGSGIEVQSECPMIEELRRLRWVTPERLLRERSTAERVALTEFLGKHGLGLLVINDGVGLTVLLGVGLPASRRPFTYPQATQLMELASIIESALERAHLSVKAQHAEQLATVGLLGASLAHEIRNPLVTIKTFVQLLPQHYNDPTFRDKFFRLIGNEVARIDRLTEQLLDLAAPRTYSSKPVDLHLLIRESLDLVTPKAADKQIKLVTELGAQPDTVFTDATAVKQVLLNLCFNAVQAVEGQPGPERWIQMATRNVAEGVELRISDSGPGIRQQMWPRLFQPFQSTKSTGFGLGLAICSDILAALNATIKADPPIPGRGATFRVTLPCPPSTS